jgi:hypothetical protein
VDSSAAERLSLTALTENVWIGLAHLKPRASKSALPKGARGTYTNALALAKDLSEFEEKIRKHAREYGLDLVEIEDAGPFDQRVESHEVSLQLLELAESIQSSRQVCFDAFYNYLSDDEVQ